MGARAQVEVKMYKGEASVYLYTHWGSESLVEDLRQALDSEAGRGRWTDNEYLARIIFEAMIGDERGTATGFGIGTAMHSDLGYDPIVIDPNTRTVTAHDMTLTFDEFVGMEG